PTLFQAVFGRYAEPADMPGERRAGHVVRPGDGLVVGETAAAPAIGGGSDGAGGGPQRGVSVVQEAAAVPGTRGAHRAVDRAGAAHAGADLGALLPRDRLRRGGGGTHGRRLRAREPGLDAGRGG